MSVAKGGPNVKDTKAQVSGDTLSTDGIDIERLELSQAAIGELQKDSKDKDKEKDKRATTTGAPLTANKNVIFNVWDFGGSYFCKFLSFVFFLILTTYFFN